MVEITAQEGSRRRAARRFAYLEIGMEVVAVAVAWVVLGPVWAIAFAVIGLVFLALSGRTERRIRRAGPAVGVEAADEVPRNL